MCVCGEKWRKSEEEKVNMTCEEDKRMLMKRKKRKVEMRERRHSIFFGAEGDQNILAVMPVTLPVCQFDTSPLNFEAA